MKSKTFLVLLLVGIVGLFLAVSVPAFLAVTIAALVLIGVPGYFLSQTKKVQHEFDNTEEQKPKDEDKHEKAA